MKKFLFILFGVFAVAGAFAAGENVPTSKGYVDSKLAEKQDIIPANDGATQVLTNTGTAGEYGTKGIYDATGEYATQAQNLVDAATMNAGVQNAIDSEFQCIEWDENDECLLLKLNSSIPGKNLFNKNDSEMQINGYFNESTDYKITAYGGGDKVLLVKVLPNTTYTIQRLIPSSVYNRFRIGTFNTNRVPKVGDKATDILFSTYSLTIHDVTITTKNDTTYLGIFCRNSGTVGSDWQEFLDGFQVELGSHATSYEPYVNLYLPAGE